MPIFSFTRITFIPNGIRAVGEEQHWHIVFCMTVGLKLLPGCDLAEIQRAAQSMPILTAITSAADGLFPVAASAWSLQIVRGRSDFGNVVRV